MKNPALLIVGCMFLLAGCSPPNRITDEQMAMIIERCKAQGLAIYVFNSMAVSRAECISVPVSVMADNELLRLPAGKHN